MIYYKLIRDNIPEICKKNKQIAVTKTLNDKEYRKALRKKLLEETNEYLKSEELSELADILEVVDALAKLQGSDFEDILRLKSKKAETNGAFDKRLQLLRTKKIG